MLLDRVVPYVDRPTPRTRPRRPSGKTTGKGPKVPGRTVAEINSTLKHEKGVKVFKNQKIKLC